MTVQTQSKGKSTSNSAAEEWVYGVCWHGNAVFNAMSFSPDQTPCHISSELLWNWLVTFWRAITCSVSRRVIDQVGCPCRWGASWSMDKPHPQWEQLIREKHYRFSSCAQRHFMLALNVWCHRTHISSSSYCQSNWLCAFLFGGRKVVLNAKW